LVNIEPCYLEEGSWLDQMPERRCWALLQHPNKAHQLPELEGLEQPPAWTYGSSLQRDFGLRMLGFGRAKSRRWD